MSGVYDGSQSLPNSGSSITEIIIKESGGIGWDMHGHKIVNVKDPNESTDKQSAVTVNFGHEFYLFKKSI